MKQKFAVPGLLALIVILVFGVYALKYYGSWWQDLHSRPWAYSTDPEAKLLVGQWRGSFTDPGGLTKTMDVEIFVPVTEDERRDRAGDHRRTHRKMSFKNKGAFDGVATVESALGTEHYEIYGHVEKKDFHALQFQCSPDETSQKTVPNYVAREATEGRWQDDLLTFQLRFTRHDADGSSETSSEGVVVDGKLVWTENPDEIPLPVTLKRVSP